MVITKKSLMLFVCILFIFGCSQQREMPAYYNYKTECLGIGLDGSQTIIAYGYGMNGKEAIAQSLRNGMYDLLFKGIVSEKQECNLKPIVPEVNAKEKYEEYFNKFFASDGEYLKFIKDTSSKKWPTTVSQNGSPRIMYKTTFHILRLELRKKLIEENIIHE